MSNFSFYYAHHLSTIEGGMVCTDDADFYEMVRMLRSHGMVREWSAESRRRELRRRPPRPQPRLHLRLPGYNVRSTEINAVIGRSQLKRLDDNNPPAHGEPPALPRNLDPDTYQTDFATEGSCNYAFTLVLREPDEALCDRVMAALRARGVEFRRGTSGGGNQLRQPYLKRLLGPEAWKAFPRATTSISSAPTSATIRRLERDKILRLCDLLNAVAEGNVRRLHGRSRLDLLDLNPASRKRVYQSLGDRTGGDREPRVDRADGDVRRTEGLVRRDDRRRGGGADGRGDWRSASATPTRC